MVSVSTIHLFVYSFSQSSITSASGACCEQALGLLGMLTMPVPMVRGSLDPSVDLLPLGSIMGRIMSPRFMCWSSNPKVMVVRGGASWRWQ